MYNRYIRNDNGSYTRIPQEEVPPQKHAPEPPKKRRKKISMGPSEDPSRFFLSRARKRLAGSGEDRPATPSDRHESLLWAKASQRLRFN